MFGKRGNPQSGGAGGSQVQEFRAPALETALPLGGGVIAPAGLPRDILEPKRSPVETPKPVVPLREKNEAYYDTKSQVFAALIDTIDLAQLSKLDPEVAREEIRDIVNDIIAIKNFAMSISEQEELLDDICNDVLGYGPLEPLLARDDIADIMVNGARKTYIEVLGKVQESGVRFRDNQQLLNICQRIVCPMVHVSTLSRRRLRSTDRS
jgi:pilus assembly protein CpaF